MRLLLDTHIFLWYITGDERIPKSDRIGIESCEEAFVSAVSIWETIVKFRLGKLPLPDEPLPWLVHQRERHGLLPLPLHESAAVRLADLPDHHRDPFDRMLVCQALEHDLAIVTVDAVLLKYPARVFSGE